MLSAVCLSVCMSVCMSGCLHVLICVFIHTYVYVYKQMCVGVSASHRASSLRAIEQVGLTSHLCSAVFECAYSE